MPSEKTSRKERQWILEELKKETRTIVLYEAPHHLEKTLRDLLEVLGNRNITLCRELTKRYEEADFTVLSEAAEKYRINEPKGEFVLVIEGRPAEEIRKEKQKSWEAISISQHMKRYLEEGMDSKNAMKAVAKDRGISKRDVYQYLLKEENKK